MASALELLAERLGVVPGYRDVISGAWRETSDDTRRLIIAALGRDASTEARARDALADLERSSTPPDAARFETVDVGIVDAKAADAAGDVGTDGEAAARCPSPAEILPAGRVFGLAVNLYAVASARGWGIGDLGDLATLCRWGAAAGADFVALNPLHVLRGGDVSPYAPSSRLFREPLYLEVEAVPELAEDRATRVWLAGETVVARRECLRVARHVDYAAVARLKLAALRRLHRIFVRRHRGRDTPRGRAYDDFRRRQGSLLDDFAVFQAVDDLFGETEGRADWRSWPAAYRQSGGPAVRQIAEQHAELVDFHRWLQFELDRQLARVAAAARREGMAIGLVHDLALGAAAGGFDAWRFAGLYAPGVELGCPPDAMNPDGQSWGLPPLDPHALAADGHRFWRRLLRANLRHAGALRVDHVLGLVRQFWIPHGSSSADGAYLKQPADELFAVVAAESRRAGALVVGEDLGTLPDGMTETLAEWGLLSTRVLLFERDEDGTFRDAAAVPERALLLATTHDLPTLAAWWHGRDLVLRRELGLLADETAYRVARATRAEERRALVERLRAAGLLDDEAQPSREAFVRAVHVFLARSPAALVTVWLEDLLGESEPVNVPGVSPSRFPAWRRRLRRPLEELIEAPEIADGLAAARRPV